MSDNEKRFTSNQRCDHCGSVVSMEIVASHSSTHRDANTPRTDLSTSNATVFELLSCPACQAVTLRCFDSQDQMRAADIKFKTLYCGTGDHSIRRPDSIKPTYSTARRFRTIDAVAYRVMLRRLAIIHECNKRKSV